MIFLAIPVYFLFARRSFEDKADSVIANDSDKTRVLYYCQKEE